MAHAMRFCVLGPVRLASRGRRVPLASDRQRAILAALLVRADETVPAEWLADAVWDGAPPPSARQSLRSHLSRLRRVLEGLDGLDDAPLITDADGYRLVLGDGDVDAARFEALVADARAIAAQRPGEAVERFDEAAGLWHGRAYGDLADAAFARAEATRLEELRSAAAGDRVAALLAAGRHTEAIGELEAAIDADPFAERPHGQLMLALYRDGRQADALATYRRLRESLAEELGIDPSPALRDLHDRMLRHAEDLRAPAPQSPPPSPPASLPPAGAGEAAGADGADLIGRGDDLAAIAALVAQRPHVTLTGPGGVGKTRLAAEVAAALSPQFPDGVHVCALSAVRDPDRLTQALVGALGIQSADGGRSDETLLTALGTRRVLLVLDNCEHLLGPVTALVARIRSRCRHVAVLATSRTPLHLGGEHIWEVPTLPVPPPDAAPAQLLASGAGALFCARAQAADPAFAATERTAPVIAELCRRLDGLPLAIELAAARVKALDVADIAARIDDRFALLTAGREDEDGRHRTLLAAIDWSFDLLSDAQARLFAQLSVFAGRFTLEAVEAVCGEDAGPGGVAALLADLVDQSMVVARRDEGALRYRLLETLRDYAGARLEDSGTAPRYRRAHAVHFVAVAERLGPRLRGPDDIASATALDESVDDFRLAHSWAVQAAETGYALRLSAALHDYAVHRMRPEAVTWAERASALPGAPDHPGWAAANATVAWGAASRRDLQGARARAQASLDRAPEGLAALRALHVLTDVALLGGRTAHCARLAERWLGLAERAGDDYHRAAAATDLALAHLHSGETEAALEWAATARAAADASGNHSVRAWALVSHAEALADHDPPQAAELLREAIGAARRVRSRFVEGVALVSLAALLGRTGEPEPALSAYREAIAHWRRLGNPLSQVTALRNLVGLLVRVGADEQAAGLHGALTSDDVPTPTFGVEAARLDAAWTAVSQRLGTDAARSAAEQGRRTALADVVDQTLALLDTLPRERGDGPSTAS